MASEEDIKNQIILDNNASFLYSLTNDKLKQQLNQIDALDSKAINVLGFSSALLAVFATSLSISGISPNEPIYFYISSGISVTAFIVIVISCLVAYWAKSWEVGPDLQEAWTNSEQYDQDKMLRWASKSFTAAYKNNKKLLRIKVCSIKSAIILLVLQIFFEAIAIAIINIF